MLVRILGLAFAASLMTQAALAENCPALQILASVPMTYDIAGRPYVPVTLGTSHQLMLVDTGGALSVISPQAVTQLGLPSHKVRIRQYSISGQFTDRAADVSSFALGDLTADRIDFMIDPDSSKFASGTWAGIIGPNILRNYDAEFDFGAGKFNLISQDHCPGKVIYWRADRAAVMPVQVTARSAHIIVPVSLDGIALHGLIDTGASRSFLNARIAESDFGLTPNTPAYSAPQGGRGIPVPWHRFHSLSLQGIEVGNPLIAVVPDLARKKVADKPATGSRLVDEDEAPGLKDITLGMDVLKKLHLFIAYKEQKLYATPAVSVGAATGTAAPH